MNKSELPILKQETPEEADARIAKEVEEVFREESNRGVESGQSKKRPDLDYYDNRREKRKNGSDVQHRGRYGIYKKG